jgi:hypothetical protein
MDELVALIKECIETEFENDVISEVDAIREVCVGITFQILFYNYTEGLKKVKSILFELLKLKL